MMKLAPIYLSHNGYSDLYFLDHSVQLVYHHFIEFRCQLNTQEMDDQGNTIPKTTLNAKCLLTTGHKHNCCKY